MSKEEIIKKHLPDDDSYRYDNVDAAMSEYADQQLSEARKRIEELENGLKGAISVIKQWHNADDVWDIYLNHAPEMKPFNSLLSNQPPNIGQDSLGNIKN